MDMLCIPLSDLRSSYPDPDPNHCGPSEPGVTRHLDEGCSDTEHCTLGRLGYPGRHQVKTIFTCPLISDHALWVVIRPSDWSYCLLIGDLDSGLTINLQFKLQLNFSEIIFCSELTPSSSVSSAASSKTSFVSPASFFTLFLYSLCDILSRWETQSLTLCMYGTFWCTGRRCSCPCSLNTFQSQ